MDIVNYVMTNAPGIINTLSQDSTILEACFLYGTTSFIAYEGLRHLFDSPMSFMGGGFMQGSIYTIGGKMLMYWTPDKYKCLIPVLCSIGTISSLIKPRMPLMEHVVRSLSIILKEFNQELDKLNNERKSRVQNSNIIENPSEFENPNINVGNPGVNVGNSSVNIGL